MVRPCGGSIVRCAKCPTTSAGPNHVQKILRKLDVQNRAQAVARGISLNLTGVLVR